MRRRGQLGRGALMPGGVRFGAAGNNGLRVRKSGCVRGDCVPAVVFCCRGMSSPDGPDRFPHPGKCRMAGFPGGGSCPVFLRSVGRGRSGAGLSDRCFEPMGRPACRRCLSPMREGLERSGSVSRRRLRTTGTEVAPSRVLPGHRQKSLRSVSDIRGPVRGGGRRVRSAEPGEDSPPDVPFGSNGEENHESRTMSRPARILSVG